MSTFDDLDRYLNSDINLNLWYDRSLFNATELINDLKDDDWERLKNSWKEKSIDWQVRLAEAVFGSDRAGVIDLLCQMLKSPFVEVASAAAESLGAMGDIWKPDASLRGDLEKLLSQVDVGE